jgi:Tol biopolymer transport system component
MVWEMKRLLPILVVAVMLVLAVGCKENGNRIAFESNRDGDFEIFVMDANGTHVQQLTDNDDWDSGPAWSPDGKRIAFESDRYGDDEIFVMDADGTNVFGMNQKGSGPDWR